MAGLPINADINKLLKLRWFELIWLLSVVVWIASLFFNVDKSILCSAKLSFPLLTVYWGWFYSKKAEIQNEIWRAKNSGGLNEKTIQKVKELQDEKRNWNYIALVIWFSLLVFCCAFSYESVTSIVQSLVLWNFNHSLLWCLWL